MTRYVVYSYSESAPNPKFVDEVDASDKKEAIVAAIDDDASTSEFRLTGDSVRGGGHYMVMAKRHIDSFSR